MADFEAVKDRIAAALDRAVAAADRLDRDGDTALSSLRAELEAERQATTRLEARLVEEGELRKRQNGELEELRGERDALQSDLEAAKEAADRSEELAALKLARESAETDAASLRAECDRLRTALEEQAGLAERLKKVNGEVTATLKMLREAQAADLVDAHMIDKAMKKELDALHAARAQDRADIEALLSALEPVMEESENA